MNPIRTLLVIGFLASAAGTAAAEEPKAPASPEPSPAPAAATAKKPGQATTAKSPPLPSVKAFEGTLDGLDGDTKTISFTTNDEKSFTVPVQMPGSPEAQERAFALAAALKVGDKIVVFCRVNAKGEPTAATALRMVDPNAPARFR